MIKTTKKDFQIFKKECVKWLQVFGLKGWEIHYSHEKIKLEWSASCSYNFTGRVATLTLNTERDEDYYNTKDIKKDAFHEVCEVFLARISVLAESRYIAETDIKEEAHAIIQTLGNILFTGD